MAFLEEMKTLLESVRKAIKASQKLSELFFAKFRHCQFRTTLRDWESLWVQHEQKLKFPRLYKELKALRRPSELLGIRSQTGRKRSDQGQCGADK